MPIEIMSFCQYTARLTERRRIGVCDQLTFLGGRKESCGGVKSQGQPAPLRSLRNGAGAFINFARLQYTCRALVLHSHSATTKRPSCRSQPPSSHNHPPTHRYSHHPKLSISFPHSTPFSHASFFPATPPISPPPLPKLSPLLRSAPKNSAPQHQRLRTRSRKRDWR